MATPVRMQLVTLLLLILFFKSHPFFIMRFLKKRCTTHPGLSSSIGSCLLLAYSALVVRKLNDATAALAGGNHSRLPETKPKKDT